MIIVPPYLRKGDTVALVCPAGYMPAEKTTICTSVLESWGYKVLAGNTIGHQHHYFSGTDEARLQDLQQMLDNPSVQAILCARGGYGTSRIIDRLHWRNFRKHPKWIIGYSDVTVLHCHLLSRFGIASLHAPMAGAFHEAGGADAFTLTLKKALRGGKMQYKTAAHPCNIPGTAEGVLWGGNLSLLAHLTGTKSLPKPQGTILFIEDVGEYLYHIDRMLLQLERAGCLGKIAGLVVGKFADMKDTVIPFGQPLEAIIYDRIRRYNIPVLFDFPVSHSAENVALKTGVKVKLTVSGNGGKLMEI